MSRRRSPVRAALAALALAGAGCGAGAGATGARSATLLDLEGRSVDPLRELGQATSVFLFTRTDCPISNRYAPEVRQLHERFGPRGVAFRLVYVDPDQPAAEIRRHVEEFGYEIEALRDPEHRLVALVGARVTPEAAVFASRGAAPELVYLGRIDDWYADFGKSRREPSTHDLEAALEAVLAGRPVPVARTRAVGCFIADLS
jgi:hypothetical protein